MGSSPLARRQPAAAASVPRPGRIIPAGAEATRTAAQPPVVTRDHPRWRGGNRQLLLRQDTDVGSSPLARRQQGSPKPGLCDRGIIPAGAEATGKPVNGFSVTGDHPRWRGGNGSWRKPVTCPGGSSPLARRQPGRRRRGLGLGWIIPAGAEATTLGGGMRKTWRDHPRWRGGNARIYQQRRFAFGSSPLARRQRCQVRAARSRHRIIPAGAEATRWQPPACAGHRDHPRWRGGN